MLTKYENVQVSPLNVLIINYLLCKCVWYLTSVEARALRRVSLVIGHFTCRFDRSVSLLYFWSVLASGSHRSSLTRRHHLLSPSLPPPQPSHLHHHCRDHCYSHNIFSLIYIFFFRRFIYIFFRSVYIRKKYIHIFVYFVDLTFFF